MKKYILLAVVIYWCSAISCQAISLSTQIKGDITTLDNSSELRGWLNLWLSNRFTIMARGYLQDPNTTAIEGLANFTLDRWTISGGIEHIFQQECTYTEVAISFHASPVNFLTVTGYFGHDAIYEIEGAFEIPIYHSISTYLTSKTRYFTTNQGFTTERATIGLLFPIWQHDTFAVKLNPYSGYAFTNPAVAHAEDWHVGIQIILWTL